MLKSNKTYSISLRCDIRIVLEVNCLILLRKVRELKPKVLEHSEVAAKICLSRFLTTNKLTHHVATTHKPQCNSREEEANEAHDFLKHIHPCLDGAYYWSPDYIINMDQMLTYAGG